MYALTTYTGGVETFIYLADLGLLEECLLVEVTHSLSSVDLSEETPR